MLNQLQRKIFLIRKSYFILIYFFYSSLLSAQQISTVDSTSRNIFYKATIAISNSIQCWDIPLTATSLVPALATLSIKQKPFSIPPSNLEQRIANKIGRTNSNSIGSYGALPALIILTGGQSVTIALLDAFGNKAVSIKDYERTVVLGKSILYTFGFTQFMKNIIHRERPDNSEDVSFYSNHTSTTFAGFSFLNYELSDWIDESYSSSDESTMRTWLKIGSATACYGWSAIVGYSRMRDNKHYLGDVLLGAAIGTGVSTLLYHLHFGNEKNDQNNFSIAPFYHDGMMICYGIHF